MRVATRRKEMSKALYLKVDINSKNKEEVNSGSRTRQVYWDTGALVEEPLYRVSMMFPWAGKHLLQTLIELRCFIDCKPLNVKDAVCLAHLSKTAQMLHPLWRFWQILISELMSSSYCSHSIFHMLLEWPLLLFYGQVFIFCLLWWSSLRSGTIS